MGNVEHPAHYNRDGAMECLEEMKLLFTPEEIAAWAKLNVWKYRYRAADKGGAEDLAKSDFYMWLYKEIYYLFPYAHNPVRGSRLVGRVCDG